MDLSQRHGIKLYDKIGYALGDVGCQLSFALIGSFLQIFYTDALHISTSKIVFLMLVARIWDAINDPIWGSVIDRRKSNKGGKYRPYLKWISIPLAIASFLSFLKIPGLTSTQYLIYAYITYIAYGMLFTCMNIPYGSLASVVSDDPNERAALSLFRSLGAGLGGLPAQVILPMFVYSTVEATNKKILEPNRLASAVAIMAIISVFVYYASYKMTKERVPATVKKGDSNVKQTVLMLLKNRPFIILCFAAMFNIAGLMYTQTNVNYLYKDYFLNKTSLIPLVTVCSYAPLVLMAPFLGKLVRRFEKKAICSAGLILAVVANFTAYAVHTKNPYVFMVFCFLNGLGTAFFTNEVWAFVTDVIDYQEKLTKIREQGTTYAFFSFFRKLGQTIAGMASSGLLGYVGYDVEHTDIVQSARAVRGIYDISTLIPAIMMLIMFLLLTFVYPLGKANLEKLHAELDIQRMNENIAE